MIYSGYVGRKTTETTWEILASLISMKPVKFSLKCLMEIRKSFNSTKIHIFYECCCSNLDTEISSNNFSYETPIAS